MFFHSAWKEDLHHRTRRFVRAICTAPIREWLAYLKSFSNRLVYLKNFSNTPATPVLVQYKLHVQIYVSDDEGPLSMHYEKTCTSIDRHHHHLKRTTPLCSYVTKKLMMQHVPVSIVIIITSKVLSNSGLYWPFGPTT